MNEERAHAESVLRQLAILGRKPSHPIDLDAIERAADAAKAENDKPATKADIGKINRRLDAIERKFERMRSHKSAA